MRGSVSLPRSIGESKPMLMFHSSLSLFYVFTFFFSLSSLSSSDAARKLKNADKQSSGQFQHLYLHSIQEKKKKKKSATSSSPTPPLKHFVSPTLSQSSAPWVIEHLVLLTPSSGLGPRCHHCPFFTLVSSSNFPSPTSLPLVLLHCELPALTVVCCSFVCFNGFNFMHELHIHCFSYYKMVLAFVL